MASNFDLSVRLRMAVEGLSEVSQLIEEIEELGGETEGAATRSAALGDELQRLREADSLVTDFRRLRDEVDATGKELGEAQDRAQTLGRELARTDNPTRELRDAFSDARHEVNRLKDAQRDQTEGLERNRRALEGVGYSSRDVSSSQREIRQSMERTTGEVQDLGRELRETRSETGREFRDPTDRLERGARTSGRAVQTLGTRLRRTAAVAAGSVAAFFGIREAIQGIGAIGRVSGEFEIMEARLESLTGSAENGQEAFDWIREFTRTTPFQMEQVTDAFVKAKAFGLDPMNGTLQAVADQAARTGGGMEALNGIVVALGQAYSKGRLQAEEMLQLVERGVPAWDLLAQSTGRSVEELRKMSEAGEIGREQIKGLIDALGESASGAAAEQMNTLQGLVSNLRDTWTQFLVEIGDAGLLEYFKQQVRDISAAFEEMRANGELQEWANRISTSISGMIETTKTLVSTLWSMRSTIAALVAIKLASWVIAAGKALVTYAKNARAATAATSLLTKAVGRLQQAFAVFASFAIGWDIGRYLSEKFAVVRKAGIALAAGLTKAFERIRGAWEIAQAAFTDDTIDEALTRHQERLREIDRIYGEQFARVENDLENIRSGHVDAADGARQQGEAAEEAAEKYQTLVDATENLTDALEDDGKARTAALDRAGEAARELGVDLNEMLTGVDQETQKSIDSLGQLADQLQEIGATSEQQDEILKAGLSATLEGLDSSEEVDATIAAIERLGESGALTTEQVSALSAQVEQHGYKMADAADDATDSTEELGDEAERTGERGSAALIKVARSAENVGKAAKGAKDGFDDLMAGARSAAAGIAAFYDATTERLVQMSERALAAFQQLRGGVPTTETDELSNRITNLDDQIRNLRSAADFGFTGITQWFRETALASSEVERAYLKQKQAVQGLIDQIDRGDASAAMMDMSVEDLSRRFDLLSEQDLGPLRQALSTAQSEVNSLRDSLEDTIASLRQELASLRGDTGEVERLRYQEERAELEQQLQRARESGDREAIQAAQEALRLQQEAYQLRQQQAQEQAEEERQREAQRQAQEEQRQQDRERRQREEEEQDYSREQREQRAERDRSSGQPSQRIDLQLPDGRSASFAGSQEDINNLLDYLNEAGARATE